MTEIEWLISTDPQAMLNWARAAIRGNTTPSVLPDGYRAISDRKLRLFACACCRDALRLTGGGQPDSCKLCDLSDDYADGLIPYSKLEAFRPTHPDCSWPLRYDSNVHTTVFNIINAKTFLPGQAALLRDIFGNPWQQYEFSAIVSPGLENSTFFLPKSWLTWNDGIVVKLAQAAYDERAGRKCDVVECRGRGKWTDVAGDFETCDTCHGTGIISDGTLDAGRLAVLADALEEAGCTEEAILRHLRGKETCPGCGGKGLMEDNGGMWHYCLWCGDGRAKGKGWRKTDAPHVRGCWCLDLILGKE